MRFLKAQQQIGNMVADVERFIQEENYSKDELVLICTEEHRSNCEAMVEIDVETVSASELDKEDTKPLEKYQLDDKDMDLYNNMIARGGFVLLAKNSSTPSHRDERDTTLNRDLTDETKESRTKEIEKNPDKSDMSTAEDVTPPGFGVDFNEPQSDAETHEDVLNPEDPDPDNHRR